MIRFSAKTNKMMQSVKMFLVVAAMAMGSMSASAYDAYSVVDSSDVVIDTLFFDDDEFFVDTIFNRLLYYDLTENGAALTYASKRTITAGTIYTSDYHGDIVIPDSISWKGMRYAVTGITDHAFYQCSELTSVSIPKTMKSIGEMAFYLCSGLTSLTLPEGLQSIGKDAFCSCSGLTAINVPSTVTSIGEGAFWTCGNLASLTVSKGNSHYDSRGGCNAIIEKQTNTLVAGCMNSVIPNDVTEIGNYAFTNCTGLTTVNFPKGLKTIGRYAFCGCEGLTSLVIPDNVTIIGGSAFRECYGLRCLTLGSSVSRIDNGALDWIEPRGILVRNATPPTIYRYSIANFCFNRSMLYIPVGSLEQYGYADIWGWFENMRETATAKSELSSWQAYTLMDAETFTYTVYDPAGRKLSTVASAISLKESNPNHSWQVIDLGGLYFLYNLGAKKYVKLGDGGLCLTDEPEPIDITDGDGGLVLAGMTDRKWALVGNDNQNVDTSVIDYVTGIVSPLGETEEGAIYKQGSTIVNLAGQRIYAPQKGLNIIGGRKVLIR